MPKRIPRPQLVQEEEEYLRTKLPGIQIRSYRRRYKNFWCWFLRIEGPAPGWKLFSILDQGPCPCYCTSGSWGLDDSLSMNLRLAYIPGGVGEDV